MELRHLRYFVAVAEALNFTRAAERLGINQPPLSLQIRQLEKEMGTALFRRLTRGVELTDAGKLMLEEARVILNQVEQAKTGVRRRARGETGQIIIGSDGGTYFHPLIPAIIRECGTKYPEIVLAPVASSTPLLVARLRAGQIDVAFLWRPISDSEGLSILPLIDEDHVVALPRGHALCNSASAPLAWLAKERFILFPRATNPGLHDSVIAACGRAGFSPILGQEAPEPSSIIPLIAAGLGVSILPRSASRILADEVVYLPVDGEMPRAELSLARRRIERSPVVHNFLAVARRIIPEANTKQNSHDLHRGSVEQAPDG